MHPRVWLQKHTGSVVETCAGPFNRQRGQPAPTFFGTNYLELVSGRFSLIAISHVIGEQNPFGVAPTFWIKLLGFSVGSFLQK